MKNNWTGLAGIGGVCLCAVAPHMASAQTAGTIAAEDKAGDDVVVTGERVRKPVVIELPNSPKARAIVTQDYIEHTVPGQSIFNAINLVPGVNYTAGDPYGGNGGGIRMRGFDASRIAFTFDGLPLNDAGNYAIYSQQQVDPELVQSVNVNFGSTDVDSPTASAAGGTVNYRTILPTETLSATAVYSHGTGNMNRVFGLINTGELTSSGTRAWVSASTQSYNLYRYADVHKSQYNARIYQPLGGKDFVSLAGFYYQHRNTGYGTPSLANINTVLGDPYPTSSTAPIRVDLTRAQFDKLFDDRSNSFLKSPICSLPSQAQAAGGTMQDDRSSCTNTRQTSLNPVDTGNLRFNSLFTLSDRLTLSMDGGYSYTHANGGGSTVFAESNANAGARNANRYQFGRVGAGVASGRDLNGDGDMLDYVRAYYPSNTQTNRLIAIAGLRYDIDANDMLRLAYTWDRARTAQTGEASYLRVDGTPWLPFSTSDASNPHAMLDAAGNVLNKRNRLTYSILHQLSGEYRGKPFDDRLAFTVGLRAALFRRNMNNACYTIAGSGSEAYCTSQTQAQVQADSGTKGFAPPYTGRIKEYRTLLPNIGLTWQMTPEVSLFGNYTKGFSAPNTEVYAYDDKVIRLGGDEVQPERTNSYDLGLRYIRGIAQAQLGGWYIQYSNRIVTTTTPVEGGGTISAARNVGAVDSKGIDASLSLSPTRWLSLYGFASYMTAKLKNDVMNGDTVVLATKGKSVVDTPDWQYGGRAQVTLPFGVVGVSAKHVGDRFVTDLNDVKAAGYTLVDLDAQIGMEWIGLKKTYVQFNVVNLLNKAYFSNLGTVTSKGGYFNFGNPRTLIASVHFEF
ncbi:TonB-dependent receptor [Sphingomonas fuzhouensis]|uniref:TonB-dependent receptor n=1 Tax=Sphingomonas fuzhouensis TaxID=3106033 RepID=UPI002AFEDB67|nr:TonB-dependent receptor [Sphingomonas sp. SGZ-02]